MPNVPLTADQLAKELNLPSAYSVQRLGRARKIPVIKISYRCHRFDLEECRAALGKLKQNAV